MDHTEIIEGIYHLDMNSNNTNNPEYICVTDSKKLHYTDITKTEGAFEDLEDDTFCIVIFQREFSREHEEQNTVKCNATTHNRLLQEQERNVRRNLVESLWGFENDIEESDAHDKKEWDEFDWIETQVLPVCKQGYKSSQKHGVVAENNKSNNYYKLPCKLLTYNLTFKITNKPKIMNSKIAKSVDTISNYEKTRPNRKEKYSKIRLYPKHSAYCISQIDPCGRLIIERMIQRHLLVEVDDIIKIGYFADTFKSYYYQSYPKRSLPKMCIIKVFKNIPLRRQNIKETSKFWAQREAMGLKRLQGIVSCPELIRHKQHIVVMSFVGDKSGQAPKIKNVKFSSSKQYVALYKEIIQAMKVMYREGNLIHGSLSENNILWHQMKCYFINFGEWLEPHEEYAYRILYSDCRSITRFFQSRNISKILTADGLFQYITGCSYKDRPSLIDAEQRKYINKTVKENMYEYI